MVTAALLRRMISLMVSLVPLLLVPPQPSEAQLFGMGPCPRYQAETLFTDQRIAQLKGSGRYSVLLSHNPNLECMSFDFIDDIKLSFNFKDMRRVDPILQSERGRYIAHPTLFRERGYLRVDMDRDGVLGSNPFGPVELVPLLFTDTYEVWVTCTGLIAVHFEHLFVLVHESAPLRTNDVTRALATSAYSTSRLSASQEESTTVVGPDPDVVSLGLQADAPIQDNSVFGIYGSYETSNLDAGFKLDAARSEGLVSRTARQTLAADIRDDLIARGFPHANALRLKYDNCAE